MKESYGKVLASHSGLEPYADDGNVVGLASTRDTDRPAIELRNPHFRVPTPWDDARLQVVLGDLCEPLIVGGGELKQCVCRALPNTCCLNGRV